MTINIIIDILFYRNSFKEKNDEELFHVDTSGKKKKILKPRNKPLNTPLKCLSSLQSTSAVAPLAKR